MERAVDAWLTHLDVERGAAKHTLSAYRRDLGRWTAYLASVGVDRPEQVRETHVTEFLARLREGDDEHGPLAATSAARTLVAVRGLHRFLALEGVLDADPARRVSPPKAPSRLPKAIPVEDVERLLEAASVGDTPASLRDRALLEVLYGTGARISEAVGLDVDDVEGEDGVVRLRGKGGKERIVPLGSYAAAALDAWLVRGRPTFAAPRGRHAGAVPQRPRRPALAAERLVGAAGLRRAGPRAGAPVAAHPAALVRHAPARGRRRRARRAGAARPRVGHDHPDLHPGHGAATP